MPSEFRGSFNTKNRGSYDQHLNNEEYDDRYEAATERAGNSKIPQRIQEESSLSFSAHESDDDSEIEEFDFEKGLIHNDSEMVLIGTEDLRKKLN